MITARISTVPLNSAERNLHEVIRKARTIRQQIAGQQEHRVDLAGAYRIQTQQAEGQHVIGYKIGLVSPVKQAQMGVNQPIYGRIFAPMLLETPVQLDQFIQPRIEPEIAVVLRDLVRSTDDAETMTHAIGGHFLGVDILDSIWQGYKFNLPEVVADGTSGGVFLLDTYGFKSMPAGDLELYLNGQLIGQGPIKALGDVPEQLKWLAHQVGPLVAGTVVFLGSPTVAVPASAGTLELVCGTVVFRAQLE
jgi:2-keto-4-pentenoate hydratase